MEGFLQNTLNTLKGFFGDALFNIFTGLVAIVVGFFVVKVVKFIIKRLLIRLPINTTVAKFLMSIFKAIIYVIYALVVADAFGIPMTGFIALIGSIGVAVGLALKDSLSNIANGIMLVVMKPFKVGDYISVNGVEGTVIAINMVSTSIQTVDNKAIIIPNNEVMADNIINYNAMSTRRLDLIYSVAYDSDVDLVKEVLLKLATEHPLSLQDPAPICRLHVQNTSSLDFTLRIWVKADDYWALKWDLNEAVVKEFAKQNIEIPYNQLDVRMRG